MKKKKKSLIAVPGLPQEWNDLHNFSGLLLPIVLVVSMPSFSGIFKWLIIEVAESF